jgi:hypothetical protein
MMSMKIALILAALVVTVGAGRAVCQETIHARTDAGKEVILMPDGTWKYAPADSSKSTSSVQGDVHIERITMAKSDNDKPGEPTTTFKPGDKTIFCILTLNQAKVGTKVRFVWKAVDVEGAEKGEIVTIDYVTKAFENKVDGHISLPRDWPKGSYKVEVHINGYLDKTIDYTVE